ncbi:MAG: hypothetical protein AAFX56_06760 [Pseudomonadota bacterium]
MNVSLKHTRTGLLALAAAGLFAAGSVADRANALYGTPDADPKDRPFDVLAAVHRQPAAPQRGSGGKIADD